MAYNSIKSRAAVNNQTNIKRVNVLAQTETRNALSVLPELNYNQQAGLVRTVIPTVVEKYGNISSLLGAQYYDEIRNIEAASLASLSNNAYTAAPFKPNYVEELDKSIGYTISRGFNGNAAAMITTALNEITLFVANYNRDTVKYNADADFVECRIQRIAEPSACAFCLTLAVNDVTYTGSANKLGDIEEYANSWHSNCNCISSPVFGPITNAIRPAYYSQYEELYSNARKRLLEEGAELPQQGSRRFENILKKELGKNGRNWRKESVSTSGFSEVLNDVRRFNPDIPDNELALSSWLYDEAARLSQQFNTSGLQGLNQRDYDILDTFFNVDAKDLQDNGLESTFGIEIKTDSITTKNIVQFVRKEQKG
jgi:hypothetical protein